MIFNMLERLIGAPPVFENLIIRDIYFLSKYVIAVVILIMLIEKILLVFNWGVKIARGDD